MERFLIKTHAQVCMPGVFSLLICKCTHPDRSAYPDIVAKRLAAIYQKQGKAFKAAAKFAVLNALSFGFLRDNMTWDWKGQVLNAVLQKVGKADNEDVESFEITYSLLERVTFLRYYLETEGAIILQIMKRVAERGELKKKDLYREIQDIFGEIYDGYSALRVNARERRALRDKLRRMKSESYDEGTLPHKAIPHIKPLVHLGLLEHHSGNGDETYRPISLGESTTVNVLIEELKDIWFMENRFSAGDYFAVVSRLTSPDVAKYVESIHSALLRSTLASGYRYMKSPVTGIVSFEALLDWCCIEMLTEHKVELSRAQVQSYVDWLYKNRPGSLRFHVDYRGKPAYLILDEESWQQVNGR
ncbi:hypothetical protein M1O14_01715 [Dehalococcoidia bacterium]|nr:hypothetical protein [Dehalococcoidia bacterium]